MLIVIMGVKKYFIAIVIPEPVSEKTEQIKQVLLKEHRLKGALRSPSHITLHRPFEWKEEKENELIEKLAAFRFDKAMTIKLKDFDFFEPRVVFINVLQEPLLYELHASLRDFSKKQLKLFNEAEDMRGFHPHVTVAFRDLKKPVFYELQSIFKEKRFEENFVYEGFSLLKFEKRWEEICFFFKKPGVQKH